MTTMNITRTSVSVLSLLLFLLSQMMVSSFVGRTFLPTSHQMTKEGTTIRIAERSPSNRKVPYHERQHQQQGRSTILFVTILPDISSLWSSLSTTSSSSVSTTEQQQSFPAYIIDCVGGGGGDDVPSSSSIRTSLTDKGYRQISDLCIDVFFKEELVNGNGWVR
jgi:uncharacterized membrane protein